MSRVGRQSTRPAAAAPARRAPASGRPGPGGCGAGGRGSPGPPCPTAPRAQPSPNPRPVAGGAAAVGSCPFLTRQIDLAPVPPQAPLQLSPGRIAGDAVEPGAEVDLTLHAGVGPIGPQKGLLQAILCVLLVREHSPEKHVQLPAEASNQLGEFRSCGRSHVRYLRLAPRQIVKWGTGGGGAGAGADPPLAEIGACPAHPARGGPTA